MCSVIATSILGMGYYTVMYGQIKGNEEETRCDDSSDSLDEKIPLLQEKMEVWTELWKILETEEFTYFPEFSSGSYSFKLIVIQVSPMLQIVQLYINDETCK